MVTVAGVAAALIRMLSFVGGPVGPLAGLRFGLRCVQYSTPENASAGNKYRNVVLVEPSLQSNVQSMV